MSGNQVRINFVQGPLTSNPSKGWTLVMPHVVTMFPALSARKARDRRARVKARRQSKGWPT